MWHPWAIETLQQTLKVTHANVEDEDGPHNIEDEVGRCECKFVKN